MTSAVQVARPDLTRIRQHGYWRVVIHPNHFQQDRIPFDDLSELFEQRAVRGLSWTFPPITDQQHYEAGPDWIGASCGSTPPLEYWRCYQSGQFLYYAALDEDWYAPFLDTAQPGQVLGIAQTVLRYTKAFVLAEQLALYRSFWDIAALHVVVDFYGLRERQLVMEDTNGQLSQQYRTTLTDFSYALDLAPLSLIAAPRTQALRAAEELFNRFGWQPAPGLLSNIQESLFWR